MYLALTYDHRLLDGREAVTFLVKVRFLFLGRRIRLTDLLFRSRNTLKILAGCCLASKCLDIHLPSLGAGSVFITRDYLFCRLLFNFRGVILSSICESAAYFNVTNISLLASYHA